MLGKLLFRAAPQAETRGAPFVVHGPGVWGVTVGTTTYDALTNAAVWACVDVLASSVSSLPVDAVRAVGNSRVPVVPAPALLVSPSALVTLDVWLYQVMESMLSDGNTFGRVTAVDAMARPTSIELVQPQLVTERKVVDGVAQAKVEGTVERVFPHGELWHVPGKMVTPGWPFALSPFVYAGKAIDAGLSAEEFGLAFFGEGGHPSALIYSDDPSLTLAKAKGIKAAFKEAMSGRREPAVLGSGLKYEKVSVDPEDSQFIDLQRFTVEQACRFFRVPPAMVYASTGGQNITYANVSQADLHYLKHSLDGYLVRIENALSALLGVAVKFNRNALLRADAETRNKVYDTRLRNKTLSVNEVKALEDEEPYADAAFDEPGIPGGADDAAPARARSVVKAVERDELGRITRVEESLR